MSEDMEQYYEKMGVSYEMCYSTLQTIFAKYNYPFIAIIQTAYFLGVTAEELLNPVVSDLILQMRNVATMSVTVIIQISIVI